MCKRACRFLLVNSFRPERILRQIVPLIFDLDQVYFVVRWRPPQRPEGCQGCTRLIDLQGEVATLLIND